MCLVLRERSKIVRAGLLHMKVKLVKLVKLVKKWDAMQLVARGSLDENGTFGGVPVPAQFRI